MRLLLLLLIAGAFCEFSIITEKITFTLEKKEADLIVKMNTTTRDSNKKWDNLFMNQTIQPFIEP